MRSLGIDVGHHSIKAVLLSSSIFGTQVLKTHTEEIDHGNVANALEECFSHCGKDAHSIVVSLNRAQAAIYLIDLPSRDPSTVRKIAPFQMEDRIPFANDALVDGWPVVPTEESSCKALLTAMRAQDVRTRQELVSSLTGNTPLYHVDAIAALNVYLSSTPSLEGCTILVDVGATKTSISIVSEGFVVATRLLLLGLREQAGSSLADDVTKEIQRSLLSCGFDDRDITRIALVGGGALDKSFTTKLAERFPKPVTPVSTPLLSDSTPVYCAALGLALSSTGNVPIPLDFDHASRPHPLLKTSNLLLACFIIFVGAIYQVVGLHMERRTLEHDRATVNEKISKLEDQIEGGPLGFSPGEDPSDYLSMVRERISLLQRDKPSTARLLAEVTSCIENESVTLHSFNVTGDRLQIQAQTDSFTTADRIKASLEASPLFSDSTYEGVNNVGPVSNRQLRFTLSLRIHGTSASKGMSR